MQKFTALPALAAAAIFTGCTTVHEVEVVHTRPVVHHTYYHETHTSTSTASSAPSPQDFNVVSQYDRQAR